MANTVERLDLEISGKADKFTQAVNEASGKLDTLVAKAQSSAQKVQSSNAGMADSYFHVVDRLKVAASAVDNLGARTDALTGKQHTAWTAIGAVVGGTTATMIQRLEKFVDSSQKAADASATSFQKTTTAMWSSTDALRVANDRIEEANAKLENKRPNILALQLDEARVMADKLADSLDSDQQKIGAVLTQNHQSWWHTLLHQGTTANLEGTVNSMGQQISDAGNQQQIDLHKGDQTAAATDRKNIDSGLAYLAKKMTGTIAEIDRDAAAGKGPDRKVERSEAVGVLATTNARQDDLAAQDQAKIDAAKNKRLTEAKEAQAAAAAAAAKAAELARQAAEDNYRAMETAREQEIQAGKLGAAADKAFWEAHIAETTKGSIQYLAIRKKIDEDDKNLALAGQQYRDEQAHGAENQARNALSLSQARTQLDLASHKIDKLTADERAAAAQTIEFADKIGALRQQLADLNNDSKVTPEDKQVHGLALGNQISDLQGQRNAQLVQNQVQQAQAAEEAAHEYREVADAIQGVTTAQEGNAASLAKMLIARDADTGAISRHDEALRLTTLHEQQAQQQLAALYQRRNDAANDTTLDPQQKQAALLKIQAQITDVSGDADRTALQDKWAEFETTGLGGAIEALAKFDAAVGDTASQMANLASQGLKSLNDVLTGELSGQYKTGGDFRGALRNSFAGDVRNVAGMGLQKGESELFKPLVSHFMGDGSASSKALQALGLAGVKPDGTASAPLYVKLVDSLLGGKDSGTTAALSAIHAQMSQSKGSASAVAPLTTPVPNLSGDAAAKQAALFAALYPLGTQGDAANSAAQGAVNAGSGASDAWAAMSKPYPQDANGTPQFSTIQGQPSAWRTALASVLNLGAGASGKFGRGSTSGGSDDDSDSDSGDPTSGLSLFTAIPGFADGTEPLSDDTWAMVGEHGPELAYLSKGTGVVPNHKLGDFKGGGFTHTGDVHVDARGSTDPGATEAAVRRGYSAAVRDSQAAMAHGQAEQKRRTPALAQR